jgi:hypothetical protein
VEVVWSEGRDSTTSTEPEIELRLSSDKPPSRYSDRAGFAVLAPEWSVGQRYAAVLYPMVQAAAKSQDTDVACLLGAAIAHEIGHLLLGAAHRTGSIMSPRLGREEMRMASRGELLFDREQAGRVRAEIARRMGR